MDAQEHPHKLLTDRIDRLKNKVSPIRIMAEAGVIYPNYYHWQKGTAVTIARWFKLLRELGIDPWSVQPGTDTYQTAKRRLLTRDAVSKLFQRAGYSDQISSKWEEEGDPRQIENFKKVNQIVTSYEHEKQKAVS